jgi:hypothetical protein
MFSCVFSSFYGSGLNRDYFLSLVWSVFVTEVNEDARFERDSEWLSRHYGDLQVDYPNKYVAVLDERVVGVWDDGEKLYVEVAGKYGRDPVIDFIKDTKTIQVGRLRARVLV